MVRDLRFEGRWMGGWVDRCVGKTLGGEGDGRLCNGPNPGYDSTVSIFSLVRYVLIYLYSHTVAAVCPSLLKATRMLGLPYRGPALRFLEMRNKKSININCVLCSVIGKAWF